jgi:phosphonate transport system substrate-binding protein
MAKRRLQALTFLAPNMLPVYRFMMAYLSSRLGYEIDLKTGEDYSKLLQADLAFVCGLPYVYYTSPRRIPASIEAIAAPVLRGDRFQNRPIYFSDVIVRRDSLFQSFADLRGRSWAFNEPLSQSGYGITRYWLVKLGETQRYFGDVIQAGFHQRAIQMVCHGEVDASAIDTQVLAIELHNHPELAEQLRVIDSLGPSTIQPLAAARDLDPGLKRNIQAALVEMHHDAAAKPYLEMGLIDHMAAVNDADYDDIREMLAACERANFVVLR